MKTNYFLAAAMCVVTATSVAAQSQPNQGLLTRLASYPFRPTTTTEVAPQTDERPGLIDSANDLQFDVSQAIYPDHGFTPYRESASKSKATPASCKNCQSGGAHHGHEVHQDLGVHQGGCDQCNSPSGCDACRPQVGCNECRSASGCSSCRPQVGCNECRSASGCNSCRPQRGCNDCGSSRCGGRCGTRPAPGYKAAPRRTLIDDYNRLRCKWNEFRGNAGVQAATRLDKARRCWLFPGTYAEPVFYGAAGCEESCTAGQCDGAIPTYTEVYEPHGLTGCNPMVKCRHRLHPYYCPQCSVTLPSCRSGAYTNRFFCAPQGYPYYTTDGFMAPANSDYCGAGEPIQEYTFEQPAPMERIIDSAPIYEPIDQPIDQPVIIEPIDEPIDQLPSVIDELPDPIDRIPSGAPQIEANSSPRIPPPLLPLPDSSV